jgi:hypothetical protein
MQCIRCEGFMIEDCFDDPGHADGHGMVAWRCINCGEVLDAVIQHHRASPSPHCAPLFKRSHPRHTNSLFVGPATRDDRL